MPPDLPHHWPHFVPKIQLNNQHSYKSPLYLNAKISVEDFHYVIIVRLLLAILSFPAAASISRCGPQIQLVEYFFLSSIATTWTWNSSNTTQPLAVYHTAQIYFTESIPSADIQHTLLRFYTHYFKFKQSISFYPNDVGRIFHRPWIFLA